MTEQNKTAETFEYKAEMKQLLHLIVHSLYTHPEVFLRELISNASDALNKVRYRQLTDKDIVDYESDLKIVIDVDEEKQMFAIEDTGIGMQKQDIIENIGTVARSGTLEFLNKMKEQKGQLDGDLIGQFGVGFYSVFMVTDEVVIETRSADKDAKAWRWTSKGEGSYTLEEIDRTERGTRISFKLKDDYKDFTKDFKVKDVINKYSNFADFPIYFGEDKINTVEALWRKNSSDVKKEELNEFYKFVSNDFEDPFDHLHLAIETGDIAFKALLFIPAKAPYDLMRVQEQKSLHLYCNKILIQDDCKDLLPDYLRFIKGVVDTADLPLNVSRETVQNSPIMGKIKNSLVNKLLTYFKRLADKQPERYRTFYKEFGTLLKMGISADFSNRDKLIELARFESSLFPPGDLRSFKDYVVSMQDDQTELYYLSGDHRDNLERDPNMEYFKKNNIEVFYLTNPVDTFVMPSIMEYDGKPLKSIEKSDLNIKKSEEKEDDNLSGSILQEFKTVLKDKVEDVVVSNRLVDSAVTLVSGKDAMDSHLEKMMRMMNKDAAMDSPKKILEVNTDHPLFKNISQRYLVNNTDPMIEQCILQLYDSALLVDGDLKSTGDFVKRLNDIMAKATEV